MSDSIAQFDILDLIATSPLGPIYRARDTKVGRTVAIRVISEGMSDPARRARALDLIQPFTALTHPHAAALFQAGEQRGSIYLVYEYVPGEKLASLIGGRPMGTRRALDLAEQVADALAEAHSLSLIHGALTPSTVVVTTKGHAKILGFGLYVGIEGDTRAGPADVATDAGRAARCEALGAARVGYAAPEQLSGQPFDHRVDLFAAGAILHEMLTGRPAFAGRTPAETGARVVQARPPIPTVLNARLPQELDAVVGRALAKKPAHRYQSAAALAADIRSASAAQHAGVQTPEEAAPAPARSPWRTGVLGALLLAAIAVSLWLWRDPIRQAWRGRFGAQPEPLLVVLPFQVAGSDESRPYYGAGFAEDLAQRLGHIPGITVLSRSVIRTSAGKPPEAIAKAAHANLAVAGTLTPSDGEWNTISIAARLVDPRNGRAIWSRTYTSAGRDVIALQARMAAEVAGWLRVAYTPTAAHNRATLRLVNPSAYDAYLQAQDALASSHDATRAAQLFQRAAAADPSLVEAQAGLAIAIYTASVLEGREHYGDARARAREAAEGAFSADPDIAPTRLAMGLTAPAWHEAFEHLRRAAELDRSNVGTLLALADALRPLDPAGATRFVARAARLDGGQPLVLLETAAGEIAVGAFDQALLAAARGQALAADLPWWDTIRLRVKLARAAAPRAVSIASAPGIRDAGDFPPATILHAADLAAAGRPADAVALLTTLSSMYPGSCEARAMNAAVLYKQGRLDEALRLANEITSRAARAADGSGWARCAVMAASAVNDAPRASAAIARIAGSDRELRAWGSASVVLDGETGLKQGVFPWGNVATAPAVVEAVKRLDAALVRSRADAARVLAGL